MPLLPAAESALLRALRDPDWPVRRAAAIALHDAGRARDEALVVLLRGARAKEKPERDSADDALLALRAPPLEMIEGPWNGATDPAALPYVRAAAAVRFLRVARGRPAQTPRLAALLDSDDEPVREAVVRYLRRRLPPPVVFEHLAAALRDVRRRGRALDALAAWWSWHFNRPTLREPARPCIDALLALARDPDPALRSRAIAVVGLWTNQREDVRRAVLAALDDPSPEVRRAATHGLRECEEARAALMRAALDPEVNVRLGAVFPLLSLAPRPDIELPFWRRVLADPSLEIEEYAIAALARLQGVDDAVTPLLESQLQSPKPRVRDEATRALNALAWRRAARDRGQPEPTPYLAPPASIEELDAAALLPRLQSTDPWTRLAAVKALVRRGPAAAAPFAPALADAALRTRSFKLRRRVARLLGAIGPAAAPAIPALIALLDDDHAAVRRNAAWALGRIH